MTEVFPPVISSSEKFQVPVHFPQSTARRVALESTATVVLLPVKLMSLQRSKIVGQVSWDGNDRGQNLRDGAGCAGGVNYSHENVSGELDTEGSRYDQMDYSQLSG